MLIGSRPRRGKLRRSRGCGGDQRGGARGLSADERRTYLDLLGKIVGNLGMSLERE